MEAQAAFDEAMKLRGAGKYPDAIARAERARALWEAALGDRSAEVGKGFSLLGDLHRRNGDLAGAEPLLQRGLSIREAALGPTHVDVAAALDNLAILYTQQGQYDRAEPVYERALAIWEAARGKNHPDLAITLNNLANNYRAQSRYERALHQHERVLAIKEAALGHMHPSVANTLNNIASVYLSLGQYDRAEPLFQQSLAIREETLGKTHPDVADSFANLSVLYINQGLYDRAEPMCERALALKEATVGKAHPDVASSLTNLAEINAGQERYDRAESLYLRALTIWETSLGKAHPNVATALNSLASIYVAQGQYGRAEPLLQRGLAIREETLGKAHPDVAESLADLAELYAARGELERASALHERALAIREASLGPVNPYVAISLRSLARLRLRQRRLVDAVPLFERALAISEGRLRREALDFSQARLAGFLQALAGDEQFLYSLARAHPEDPGAKRVALAATLLFKGRSVEEATNTSRAILRSLGSQDRDTFERLRGLRTRLAKLSLDGPGDLAPEKYQQRLKDLGGEGDALETQLASRSASLRAQAEAPLPAEIIGRVAAALPADGALVEMVAYADRPLAPKPGLPQAKLLPQPRYLAMVLLPNGATAAVDLGPAAPIDEAAGRLRDALAGQDARFDGAAQNAYRLAFKPLLPLLGKAKRLFLSPDGQVALVPFAALHDGRRFLADTYDITYLTSGRDLLPRAGEAPVAGPIVVLADPVYAASAPVAHASTSERSYSVERFYTLERGLSGQRWSPLPGTRQEAESIRQIIPQAQVFVGAEASKERLLHLAAPRVLHIATHGFFLEDRPVPAEGRGLGEVGPVGASPGSMPDPLLRSGLVLAGAGAPEDLSDSLVTALELAGIDLLGTELVVLSACDTGRGDVKLGQGVYGLRRALVIAGAETVVVSLWKVDDETTRSMMESYYRNLLAGQGRVAALREAMLTLRKEYPHPHYWAPFIGIGRDAPLRQFAPTSR